MSLNSDTETTPVDYAAMLRQRLTDIYGPFEMFAERVLSNKKCHTQLFGVIPQVPRSMSTPYMSRTPPPPPAHICLQNMQNLVASPLLPHVDKMNRQKESSSGVPSASSSIIPSSEDNRENLQKTRKKRREKEIESRRRENGKDGKGLNEERNGGGQKKETDPSTSPSPSQFPQGQASSPPPSQSPIPSLPTSVIIAKMSELAVLLTPPKAPGKKEEVRRKGVVSTERRRREGEIEEEKRKEKKKRDAEEKRKERMRKEEEERKRELEEKAREESEELKRLEAEEEKRSREVEEEKRRREAEEEKKRRELEEEKRRREAEEEKRRREVEEEKRRREAEEEKRRREAEEEKRRRDNAEIERKDKEQREKEKAREEEEKKRKERKERERVEVQEDERKKRRKENSEAKEKRNELRYNLEGTEKRGIGDGKGLLQLHGLPPDKIEALKEREQRRKRKAESRQGKEERKEGQVKTEREVERREVQLKTETEVDRREEQEKDFLARSQPAVAAQPEQPTPHISPVEFFTRKAKEDKRRADRETDRMERALLYLESVVYFILSVSDQNLLCLTHEAHSKTFCIIKDTAELAKVASALVADSSHSSSATCLHSPDQSSRIRLLVFRLQALFSMYMYRLRADMLPKLEASIAPLEALVEKATIPQHSQPMMLVPAQLWSLKSSQLKTLLLLSAAHSSWDEATRSSSPSDAWFFDGVDGLCPSPLRLDSSLSALAVWLLTAVQWMRAEHAEMKTSAIS